MVQVACGASHVLALSTDGELFAWGRGDGGKPTAQLQLLESLSQLSIMLGSFPILSFLFFFPRILTIH